MVETIAVVLICVSAVILGFAMVMDAIWQGRERERKEVERMTALWRQVWGARW